MKRLIFYSVLFFMIGGASSSDSSHFYEGPDYSFFDLPSTSSSDVEEGEIVESARVKRARSFESDDDINDGSNRDNVMRRFNHEGAHFSGFDSDIEGNHSDSEDEEDLEVVVDNKDDNIIESNLEIENLYSEYTDEQLEEIDLVAVSNRNAGVEAGKEEALREPGLYVKIGGIFQKREGDVPYKAPLDLKKVHVTEETYLRVAEAMTKFVNINVDKLYDQNINVFVDILTSFSGLEHSKESYEMVLKAVVDILGIDYQDDDKDEAN